MKKQNKMSSSELMDIIFKILDNGAGICHYRNCFSDAEILNIKQGITELVYLAKLEEIRTLQNSIIKEYK